MPNATYYWDTSVFLSYINGEVPRLGHVRPLLEAAQKGTVEIVTSTLTVAEVAFSAAEQQGQALDPAVEKAIEGLWAIGGPVRLVEFTQLTAERARRTMREAITKGRSLKPLDAIHLATAIGVGVDEVHAYDVRWAPYAADLNLRIVEPQAPRPQLGI